MIRKPSILGFILIFLGAGCFPDDELPLEFQDYQVAQLLAGNDSKSWQLIGKSESGTQIPVDSCELDDLVVFQVLDDSVYFYSPGDLCPGQQDSLIFAGKWEVIQDEISTSADTIQILSILSSMVVIDTTFDEEVPPNIISIDTSLVFEFDTSFWQIKQITSQFLEISRESPFVDTETFEYLNPQ